MASPPVPRYLRPLLASLQNILQDEYNWSDLTIKCGDRTWDVHQVIVRFQCQILGNFAENSGNDIVTLNDDPPGAVDAMMKYFYGIEYSDSQDAEDGIPSIRLSVQVYRIANKYELPALAEQAVAKFKVRAINEWNTDAFADAIEELYSTATEDNEALCKIAVGVTATHARDLNTQQFGARFHQVLLATPSFAAKVLLRAMTLEDDASASSRESVRRTASSETMNVRSVEDNDEEGPVNTMMFNHPIRRYHEEGPTYKCPSCARDIQGGSIEDWISASGWVYMRCVPCGYTGKRAEYRMVARG